jgi:hypothetical protein
VQELLLQLEEPRLELLVAASEHFKRYAIWTDECYSANAFNPKDMTYFMHLAVWPPKSSLTPNSKKLCDVTVEYGGGGEHEVQQMVNTQKF